MWYLFHTASYYVFTDFVGIYETFLVKNINIGVQSFNFSYDYTSPDNKTYSTQIIWSQ